MENIVIFFCILWQRQRLPDVSELDPLRSNPTLDLTDPRRFFGMHSTHSILSKKLVKLKWCLKYAFGNKKNILHDTFSETKDEIWGYGRYEIKSSKHFSVKNILFLNIKNFFFQTNFTVKSILRIKQIFVLNDWLIFMVEIYWD